jgi:seryl-tRNA synthetase
MKGSRQFRAICRGGVFTLLLASGCIPEGRFFHRHREDECSACQAPTLDGIQPEPGMEEAVAQRDLNREEARRLADVEQDRQRLLNRVHELEAELAEKDHALKQASEEIQAGTNEVARTRAELQRWNQDLAALRARLQNAEKENLTTLQSVISALEQVLPRDKPPPSPQEPERLGMPRRQDSP